MINLNATNTNSRMTNADIENRLGALIQNERRNTTEILNLINLADERGVHLERGFSSLFDWLVNGFGYSESSAYRRIEAARLLRSVPEAAAKFESGKINLTTMAKVHSAIRMQERKSKTRVSENDRASAVKLIENKSKVQSEQILVSLFPAAGLSVTHESKRAVDATTTRLAVNLPDQVVQDLNRARDLLAHAIPYANYADIIQRLVKEFLDRKDPLRKVEKARECRSLPR